MKMSKIKFRGNNILVTKDRLKSNEIGLGEFFIYELRHSNENYNVLCTIEDRVSVDYWGTLLSPVELVTNSYIELHLDESDLLASNCNNFVEVDLLDSLQIIEELNKDFSDIQLNTPLGELKADIIKGKFPGIRISLNDITIDIIEYNPIKEEIKTIVYDLSDMDPVDIITNFNENMVILD